MTPEDANASAIYLVATLLADDRDRVVDVALRTMVAEAAAQMCLPEIVETLSEGSVQGECETVNLTSIF